MASKVQQVKNDQGYIKKGPSCGNCVYFTSDFVDNGYGYPVEKNKRCGKGKFAVTKIAYCKLHEFKKDE